ncbi:hypothetical protein D3C71_1827830 [compost metagenome]
MPLGVAFGDVDDLVQGEDRQFAERGPGTRRVGLVEPAASIQRLQLGEREGADRAVLSLWEALGDIAGTRQHIVMDHHQHAVTAALQVEFQVVGALVAGQQVGWGGGFRGIVRGAAVGDHRRVRNAVGGGQGLAIVGGSG